MEATEKVKLLQTIYAGALADSVLSLGREGVLESVTRQKRAEQLAAGKLRAAQLGIASPEEVFTKLSDLMGAQSPCQIYCLDPMEGMVKGLDATAEFMVKQTLFDGATCTVEVSRRF